MICMFKWLFWPTKGVINHQIISQHKQNIISLWFTELLYSHFCPPLLSILVLTVLICFLLVFRLQKLIQWAMCLIFGAENTSNCNCHDGFHFCLCVKQIHTSLDWIFNSICKMPQLVVCGCHLNKTYQIEFSSEFTKLFWHPK